MDNIKLTFAIVTYNRRGELELNMNNLIPIAQKYPVEILVCDNASTDDTSTYCKKLTAQYDFISYFRQKENVGYDGNVLSAFTVAKATYVWVNGDTRTIVESEFPYLMDIVQKEEYDSISFHDDKKYDEQLFVTSDLSELLSAEGFRYSLVGSFIIRKPLTDPVVYKQYVNLKFMHIPFLFETLSRKSDTKNRVLSNKYFRLVEDGRKSRTFWNEHTFETFSKCWFHTIMALPNSLSVDSKIKCLKGIPAGHIFSFKSVLRKYALGRVKKADYRIGRPYLEFTSHTSVWLLDMMFFIPRPIVILCVSLVNLFKMK